MMLKIITFMGKLCGVFCRTVDFRRKCWYVRYIFQRAWITAYYCKSFRIFGEGAQLAAGVTLLHPEYMSIGKNTSILKNCVLEVCSPEGSLEIGDGTSIGEYSHITAAGKVSIGNNVLTGRFVLITDNSHGTAVSREELQIPPLSRPVCFNGAVIIEDNVWLGDRVTILPGVHIGQGCIIGANSVVTKDIPAFSVAVGNPCRVIKQR